MNTLVIIAIAVLVLIAIVIGIILLTRSGGNEADKRTDFTLLCNEWAAKGCSGSYYYGNEEKIKQAIKCDDLNTCKGKCSAAGFC